jgi:SAM-dependent methyltransferase
MSTAGPTSDWWESFYDETLTELFLVREPGELEATLGFLSDRLGLGPGAVVYDQCCGIGSLSIPLAERGMNVVGLDLCEVYVRRARATAAALGLSCAFHHGDAFDFVPARPCDAAFNWYTSFGYAAEDERNRLMLQRAFDALRPGGRFALDFPNMVQLLREFQPCTLRRRGTDGQEVLLLREGRLDLEGGFLKQVWTCLMPDGRRWSRPSRVRLYLPHQLADLLGQCGFRDVHLAGGVRGEALSPTSPRCICLARRP